MLWFLLRIWTAWQHPATVFPCDPVDGPKIEWTHQQRIDGAREASREHMRARGASKLFVDFVDVAGKRETDYQPSQWHDGGNGLGMHGLNIRFHSRGRYLCDPRQSADAVRDLAYRCIRYHKVKTVRELQHCYGGRMHCIGDGHPTKVCTGAQQDHNHRSICVPMGRRGHRCDAPIGLEDLGR